MDHLGIDKFMVMGFCIGGPLIWNLLKRAPNRVVAAVAAQPSGCRAEAPTLMYDTNMHGLGTGLREAPSQRDDGAGRPVPDQDVQSNRGLHLAGDARLREAVPEPGADPAGRHPGASVQVAMEAAMLAPKAEVSMFPWKEPKERIPLAVRQIRFVPQGASACCDVADRARSRRYAVLREGPGSHPLRGSRFRLPVAAHRRRGIELDDRRVDQSLRRDSESSRASTAASRRICATPIAGQSSGPLEIDRPWDSHTDDHLGLMDHLGIDKFMVMGFCIGGPFIWNLLKRAPNRVVAAVPAQPSRVPAGDADAPLRRQHDRLGSGVSSSAGPRSRWRWSRSYLTRMYRTNPDFVFTVTRDFVRSCQTPVLILPDDVPAHPYAVAMERAMLAPKAEVSMFPWKEPKERIPLRRAAARSIPFPQGPSAATNAA